MTEMQLSLPRYSVEILDDSLFSVMSVVGIGGLADLGQLAYYRVGSS